MFFKERQALLMFVIKGKQKRKKLLNGRKKKVGQNQEEKDFQKYLQGEQLYKQMMNIFQEK